MTQGFTQSEKDYLWANTKGFFYLFLAEAALLLTAGTATALIRPIWTPGGIFCGLCAAAAVSFHLYNSHVEQLAINIVNQRKQRAPEQSEGA